MSGIGMVAKTLLSPLLTATGILGKPKMQAAAVQPTITNNPAIAALRNADLLRARRGAAGNTFAGATEAVTPGARALFGQGG